ncbi:MAG: lysophospholipid acyltransferase family protein [Melioribacteraceae bacterium]|nr:lysophospholipid acyltransferase family protein [Melioribacteraceae bacterium]MCF8262912.1 lysophospholipid acyltransferase family protein [Melioribacteraceae bacterium]MCF8411935.1 lysophospholipid acyltransferase family protein [Melioribacteraceae bacterium]MCF8430930.1 lysophospholipid acyltransferase family protein [Melioribacteraceae bacterium]
MIKTEHKKWAHFLFDKYIHRLLKKNFSNFWITNDLPNISNSEKLIITPNHISWWDGFFVDFINKSLLHRNIHVMMLEDQLKRYHFFNKVGAYSIDPSNTKKIKESFDYTLETINDPRNFSVIYTQGEIEAYEKRPLAIKRGIQLISRMAEFEFTVLPVVFRIQHFEEKNPALICRFGSKISSSELKDDWTVFETKFYDTLDNLAQDAFNKKFGRDLFQYD